jgi:peptidoglycan/LPS O-acetylase OafA/YrhL
MIQRIQTLYLAIALGLMTSLFFGIYATYTPFLILTAAVCALLVLTIFLFKARKIQIRLCIYTSLIMLGLQIWIGAVYIKNTGDMPFPVTTVFPLVSIILIILALRAIGSDEALVQSYNRLRSKKGKK